MAMTNGKWLIDVNAIPESATVISVDGRLFVAWSAIVDAPIVDAVEVVHAKWEKIKFHNESTAYRCTACKSTWIWNTRYCPHCGAKMDLEEVN